MQAYSYCHFVEIGTYVGLLRGMKLSKPLFSEEFHKAFKPSFEMLHIQTEFVSKSSIKECLANICIAPDWLSVEQINKQVPDMPNKLPSKSKVLEYSERVGDVRGHRSIEIRAYVTATLTDEPKKVIGCLFFHIEMTHAPRKQSLDMVISLLGVSVKKTYRRRKIATTLGNLTGQCLAGKIIAATSLLKPAKGNIILYSEFNHEGGEACYDEMARQIVAHSHDFFPMLSVSLDGGW